MRSVSLWRSQDVCSISLFPPMMVLLPFHSSISYIEHSRKSRISTDTLIARAGFRSQQEKALGHWLIFNAGRSKAKAGDHSGGSGGNDQVESFIPAEVVAPP